jgi:hypothetical protein
MDAANGRQALEVADVFRAYGDEYRRLHAPSPAQLAVMHHIEICRTAALGGHVDRCDTCGYERISFNSCRDRHCPKCQSLAKAAWLERRCEHLLPVPYFHVVFTLPAELNPLMLGNKRQTFAILFESAAAALKTLAADPQHLGADIGFTAVLHTWGQNLNFHPHLHCVVTGGGLSPDGERWVEPKSRGKTRRKPFLFPVKVLSRLFRGKFLAALEKARSNRDLAFEGGTAELADPQSWRRVIDGLHRKEWVVYAKRPFAGPEQVFSYLGRYTHRVALSNHRLLRMKDGKVTFRLKNYAEDGKKGTMTLEAVEFIRRFLLHVLPKKFTRIRHYGLLAGRNVNTKLAAAKRLLGPPSINESAIPAAKLRELPWQERLLVLTGVDVTACPKCTKGRLVRRPLPASPIPFPVPTHPWPEAFGSWDTS